MAAATSSARMPWGGGGVFLPRLLAARTLPPRHVAQTVKALVGIAIAGATLPAWT